MALLSHIDAVCNEVTFSQLVLCGVRFRSSHRLHENGYIACGFWGYCEKTNRRRYVGQTEAIAFVRRDGSVQTYGIR
jgi:hypothetical protein